jgi:hypothetical protein
MLVKYGVNAVFHGHDHFYAHQELDGVVYPSAPQPAHQVFSYPRSAEEYGYTKGTIMVGSGHMRFRVSDKEINAEYIRGDIARDGRPESNGQVLHRYTMQPAR